MQAQLFFNQYAVNVYFDDITLRKPFIVPVNLISFTGNEAEGKIYLQWNTANESTGSHYEIEQSIDGINFMNITSITGGKQHYSFTQNNTSDGNELYYYRLKIIDKDGQFSYSNVLTIKIKYTKGFNISPNPAKNFVTISGINRPGTVSIIHTNGAVLFTAKASNPSTNINISSFPAGLYIVRFADGKNTSFKKLVIRTSR